MPVNISNISHIHWYMTMVRSLVVYICTLALMSLMLSKTHLVATTGHKFNFASYTRRGYCVWIKSKMDFARESKILRLQ